MSARASGLFAGTSSGGDVDTEMLDHHGQRLVLATWVLAAVAVPAAKLAALLLATPGARVHVFTADDAFYYLVS